MNRIIVTLLSGSIFIFVSYGQSFKNTVHINTIAGTGTITSATNPIDTLSKKETDPVALHKDTTVLYSYNMNSNNAAHKDTVLQEPRVITFATGVNSLDPGGYKDAHWGMTLRNVRDYLVNHDGVKDSAIEIITNGFEYTGQFSGVSASWTYQFDSDRLFIVRQTPQVRAISKFDFLDSFENYRTLLEAKYGKPARSGFSKIDDSYLNTVESIQLGYAKKYELWEFDRSYIVLALVGRDKKLGIHITYVSRAIFDELSSKIETLKVEDF
ncbi:MAG: hypothetical protein WBZ48_00745 [Bacteroidota bacterium]